MIQTAWALTFQNKLWTHQIESQPKNVTFALQILEEIHLQNGGFGDANGGAAQQVESSSYDESDDAPFVEAIKVCGKCKRPDIALDIFQNRRPTEACRTMTISVLGNCQQHRQALDLLSFKIPSSSSSSSSDGDETNETTSAVSIASYNSAIAACGKAKDWKLALEVFQEKIPQTLITTLTGNAMLTVLANCRQGTHALQVLTTMPCEPDRVSYQFAISALLRSNLVNNAFELLETITLLDEEKKDADADADTDAYPTTLPTPVLILQNKNDAMYDMVIAAYRRDSNWEAIQKVERLRDPNGDHDHKQSLFQHWEGLTKVGKGDDSYWEVGTYKPLNLTIGIHPNRNPVKNGIQLQFYENTIIATSATASERNRLGFLLMQNSDNQSSLMGMFLENQCRGRGIAKICLGVWIWICLQAKIEPTTGVINKPLLALLLQHRFGFIPVKGGVEVELAPDPDDPDVTLLYAPSRKSLPGAFSASDLHHQKLRLINVPPEPRGRLVQVRCKFKAPDSTSALQELVDKILLSDDNDASIGCDLTGKDLRLIYLGRER